MHTHARTDIVAAICETCWRYTVACNKNFNYIRTTQNCGKRVNSSVGTYHILQQIGECNVLQAICSWSVHSFDHIHLVHWLTASHPIRWHKHRWWKQMHTLTHLIRKTGMPLLYLYRCVRLFLHVSYFRMTICHPIIMPFSYEYAVLGMCTTHHTLIKLVKSCTLRLY